MSTFIATNQQKIANQQLQQPAKFDQQKPVQSEPKKVIRQDKKPGKKNPDMEAELQLLGLKTELKKQAIYVKYLRASDKKLSDFLSTIHKDYTLDDLIAYASKTNLKDVLKNDFLTANK